MVLLKKVHHGSCKESSSLLFFSVCFTFHSIQKRKKRHSFSDAFRMLYIGYVG